MHPTYETHLLEQAERLARTASRPVGVEHICSQLGIAIRRSRELKNTARLVSHQGRFEIVVGGDDSHGASFSPRERFLIAHELGHSLLEQKQAEKPIGKSEYWKLENLCDNFARRLLLPRRHLEETARLSGTRAADRLRLAEYLKRKWHVPWEIAAFEITELDHVCYFLRISWVGKKLVVASSTFPRKRYLHKQIAQSPLLNMLRSITSSPAELPVAAFAEQFGFQVQELAAARISGGLEFRVVAIAASQSEQND